MAPNTQPRVLLPLKVDAFVLNKPVVDAEFDPNNKDKSQVKAKIAPIVQPNYSFLSLSKDFIQNDILNPVDLHNSWPSQYNSRFTDIDTGKERKHRQGVYVHWTIPRLYRSGVTETKSSNPDSPDPPNVDKSAPDFLCVPTRWLVVRTITKRDSVKPASAWDEGLKPVTGWIVESDRRFDLDKTGNDPDKIGDDVDLQVDVSPFIYAQSENVKLDKQAEVFIGRKTEALKWVEDKSASRIPNFKLVMSSNQLFADYQPHCTNVFSIVDNFQYKEDAYLTEASASYSVIGWHSDATDDVFNKKLNHQDRMNALQLEINGAVTNPDNDIQKAFETWLKANDETLTLCHGAIYSVKWDASKKPSKVPADDYCQQLNSLLPISVGTTPMDALMAYARPHSSKDTGVVKELEGLLLELEKHLLARDDGVEAQQQAKDLLYNWNYIRNEGGKSYHVAGNEEPTAVPDNLRGLIELNREQQFLDAIERTLKRSRWYMFSEWWKEVTDSSPSDDRSEKRKGDVQDLKDRIDDLITMRNVCNNRIQDALKSQKQLEPGVTSAFYQQRDPTVLVGGIRTGWEHDYLSKLQIRLESQLVANTQLPELADEKSAWNIFLNAISTRLPSDLSPTMQDLLREFVTLQPENTDPSLSGVKRYPQFHDQLTIGADMPKNWRDRWNDTQPWFPLFMEWEVEYHHVDFEDFTLSPRRSRPGEANKLRYGIDPDIDLNDKYAARKNRDKRSFSGRALILPQPTFSLEAKIQQLFSDTPTDKLGDILDKTKRDKLEQELYHLAFLSAPLDGFTAHLTTLQQGSHIRPILRKTTQQGVEFVPIKESLRPVAGFEMEEMKEIELETDQTPYWTSELFLNHYPLFKPVAHGQFKFKKLNIIDKFGQAIHAIDPTPSRTPQKLLPCISEWYTPQPKKTDPQIPNVIQPETDEEKKSNCEYVQIPPQIHQLTRLNSAFVVPYSWQKSTMMPHELDTPVTEPFWRQANEWENPIWGWVVINYANFGIQLFLPDGTFYREVRLRGLLGPMKSPEWLPFEPPQNPSKEKELELLQLKLLVEKLSDHQYLTEFVKMINLSKESMEPAPDAYAEFTNALVGRPLALVNVGWSLELANDAFVTQADEEIALPKYLTPSADPKRPRPTYSFGLKFGDRQRGFDGLVGYFESRKIPEPGNSLELGNIYTDYDRPIPPELTETSADPDPNQYLKKSKYEKISAFWIDPYGLDAKEYDRELNNNWRVFGALVDPFSPIHTYSGILPVKELSLPPWTWQGALSSMKAFFHAGPLVVVQDVPNFDKNKILRPDIPVNLPKKAKNDKSAVALPAMSSAEWAWLQPYVPEDPKPDSPKTLSDIDVKERYMALPVTMEDERAKFVTEPYTALEGYLLMAGPPAQDDNKP